MIRQFQEFMDSTRADFCFSSACPAASAWKSCSVYAMMLCTILLLCHYYSTLLYSYVAILVLLYYISMSPFLFVVPCHYMLLYILYHYHYNPSIVTQTDPHLCSSARAATSAWNPYTYIYIYTHMYTCVYIYNICVYIYISYIYIYIYYYYYYYY